MSTVNQLVRKARQSEDIQERFAGLGQLSAASRRLHARLHHHTEEAELGVAQSGQGPLDQRLRGDQLHRWRRTQSAGAFGRVDSRRSRQGSARRALSHGARQPRCCRCHQASSEPFEVRRQAAESLIDGSYAQTAVTGPLPTRVFGHEICREKVKLQLAPAAGSEARQSR